MKVVSPKQKMSLHQVAGHALDQESSKIDAVVVFVLLLMITKKMAMVLMPPKSVSLSNHGMKFFQMK